MRYKSVVEHELMAMIAVLLAVGLCGVGLIAAIARVVGWWLHA